MAIVNVQTVSAVPSSPVSIAATSADNLLVVFVMSTGGSTPGATGITDNQSNTYTVALNSYSTHSSANIEVYYAKNISAGTTTLSFTGGVGQTLTGVSILEYSGTDSTTPIGSTSREVGTSGPVGPSLTATADAQLLLAGVIGNASPLSGVSSPWVSRSNNSFGSVADFNVLTAGTFQAAFTPTTIQGFCSTGIVINAYAVVPILLVHQSVEFQSGGTTIVQTIPSTTNGNLLVIALSAFWLSTLGTIIGVSDDKGNTYTHVPNTLSVTDTSRFTDFWYCNNCIGGATTVTVTFSNTVQGLAFVVEYSGVATVNSIDTATQLSNQVGSAVGPSLTSTIEGDLFVSVASPATTVLTGVSSPWDNFSDGFANTIPEIVGTFQANFIPTTTQHFCSSGVAFKAEAIPLDVITRIQTVNADPGVTNPVTIAATGSGNLIVIGATPNGAGITSITDNVGNVYVQAPGAIATAGSFHTDIWYAKNSIAGATAVTFTGSIFRVSISEYSGADTVNPLASTGSLSTSGSPVAPILTLNDPGGMLFVVGEGTSEDLTSTSSPWENLRNGGSGTVADLIPLTTGTFQATFTPTTSQGYISSGAVFVTIPYGFNRAITIDHTKVIGADQTDFPMLFSGVFPYLATTANGGNVENSNGYDIIFTSDALGTTFLNWEIETYDATTGTVNFWVQIPTLSHTVDTVIYIFYGNSAISTFQGNAHGTWDSNYQAVYHLTEAGSTCADSTVNNITATKTNSSNPSQSTNAQFGFSQQYDGTNFINTNNAILSNGSSLATVSSWINESVSNTAGDIITRGRDGFGSGWSVGLGQTNFSIVTSSSIEFDVNKPSVSTGQWHYLVGTWDGSTVTYYQDGVSVGSASTTGSGFRSSTMGFLFGEDNAGLIWTGFAQEMRISDIARTADWIHTEYNNQFSPNTFYTIESFALSLSLSDSVVASDSTVEAFYTAVSDVAASSDTFPQSIAIQSDFLAVTNTPTVETLVNQLVPASVKTYFRIEE